MPRERRRDVIRRGPAALFVVAGLPPTTHGEADPAIRSVVPGEIRVISHPTKERDGQLYSEPQVTSLVRALTSFAVRRRRNEKDGDEDRLASLFRQINRGNRGWSDRFPELRLA